MTARLQKTFVGMAYFTKTAITCECLANPDEIWYTSAGCDFVEFSHLLVNSWCYNKQNISKCQYLLNHLINQVEIL